MTDIGTVQVVDGELCVAVDRNAAGDPIWALVEEQCAECGAGLDPLVTHGTDPEVCELCCPTCREED